MAKSCPVCRQKVDIPSSHLKSTHIDFMCGNCGVRLRHDVGIPAILTVLVGLPLVVCAYAASPKLTFWGGDGLIFLAIGALFWPLGRLTLRGEVS
jgi:hypothetical protein